MMDGYSVGSRVVLVRAGPLGLLVTPCLVHRLSLDFTAETGGNADVSYQLVSIVDGVFIEADSSEVCDDPETPWNVRDHIEKWLRETFETAEKAAEEGAKEATEDGKHIPIGGEGSLPDVTPPAPDTFGFAKSTETP